MSPEYFTRCAAPATFMGYISSTLRDGHVMRTDPFATTGVKDADHKLSISYESCRAA